MSKISSLRANLPLLRLYGRLFVDKYTCASCTKAISPGQTFLIETHGMVREDKDGNQYYTEAKQFICEECQ